MEPWTTPFPVQIRGGLLDKISHYDDGKTTTLVPRPLIRRGPAQGNSGALSVCTPPSVHSTIQLFPIAVSPAAIPSGTSVMLASDWHPWTMLDGTDLQATFTWTHDGHVISGGGGVYGGANGPCLFINAGTSAQDGTYEVTLSGAFGSASQSIDLTYV